MLAIAWTGIITAIYIGPHKKLAEQVISTENFFGDEIKLNYNENGTQSIIISGANNSTRYLSVGAEDKIIAAPAEAKSKVIASSGIIWVQVDTYGDGKKKFILWYSEPNRKP